MTDAPDLSDVFAYIDARRDAAVAWLIDYVRRPSISTDGTGLDAIVPYPGGLLQRLGLALRVIPTEGNLLALYSYP